MIDTNIKNLTSDFIENERSVLVKEVVPETRIFGEDQYQEEQSIITESINTELVNQRRSSGLLQTSEISIITDSKTDYSGVSPKRYTTTCYLHPKTVPYWYTESILLFINSTKKIYEDKVFFKNKLTPVKWSETMHTEVTFPGNQHFYSSVEIPLNDVYIPLEQVTAC